jgi:hypothetical protein
MRFDLSTEDTENTEIQHGVVGARLAASRLTEHLTLATASLRPAFGHPSPRCGEGLGRLAGAVLAAPDLSTEDTEHYARKDRARSLLRPLCSLWIVTDASPRRLSLEVC